MILKYVLYIIIILCSAVEAQEKNITAVLKMVESGNLEEAREQLAQLLTDSPNDPSVKFLDAVLTEDGQRACSIYEDIYTNHPESNYADAALYRLFSFYFAKGLYNKADSFKKSLMRDYAGSPYIRAVNRDIPDSDETDAIDEPIKSSTAKPVSQVKNSNSVYTIQAGAFLNINNAKNLSAQFTEDGYVSEVTVKDIGGSIFNIVTVGKFATQPEADDFLNLLKSRYKIIGRIISLN